MTENSDGDQEEESRSSSEEQAGPAAEDFTEGEITPNLEQGDNSSIHQVPESAQVDDEAMLEGAILPQGGEFRGLAWRAVPCRQSSLNRRCTGECSRTYFG